MASKAKRRKRERLLYHGGVANLRRGDLILPDMAHRRFVEGCPHCEAQKRGDAVLDPSTPAGWVYATSHRLYARYHASRAVRGDLYKVRLIGEIERSAEDRFPTWRARKAEVVRIEERRIILTMKERRNLFVQWGGTPEEFELLMVGLAERRRRMRPGRVTTRPPGRWGGGDKTDG